MSGPNQLWVADVTYVATWAGLLYLAVVADACRHLWRRHGWSRRVVGWAMAHHLRTELVLQALRKASPPWGEMALRQRRPVGVIHHSDQGGQYTALAFGQRCREAGICPSKGSVGNCYDNALRQSFFASLEWERLDRCTFATRDKARLAVFEYFEGWYNPCGAILASATSRPCALSWPLPIESDPKPSTIHQTGATPRDCWRGSLAREG